MSSKALPSAELKYACFPAQGGPFLLSRVARLATMASARLAVLLNAVFAETKALPYGLSDRLQAE